MAHSFLALGRHFCMYMSVLVGNRHWRIIPFPPVGRSFRASSICLRPYQYGAIESNLKHQRMTLKAWDYNILPTPRLRLYEDTSVPPCPRLHRLETNFPHRSPVHAYRRSSKRASCELPIYEYDTICTPRSKNLDPDPDLGHPTKYA